MPRPTRWEQEGGRHVGGEEFVPIGQFELEERSPPLDPGVVDENVRSAPEPLDISDAPVHLTLVGEVEGADQCLATGGRRQCLGCRGCSVSVATVDDNPRARLE
jgi:hypothetical protein